MPLPPMPPISGGPQQTYTTYVPAKTNHVLHLLLTIVTLGMWAPVWLIMTVVNSSRLVPQVTYFNPVQYQPGQYPNHPYGGQQ
jgi:hypothetical protein